MVGGGLGGLATAARLGKLGHQVTLVERAPRLGGVIRTLTHDTAGGTAFRWDAGPAATTLPAALRDLFRKSGRPLERVVELSPVTTPRRHVFADGTVLDLPVGSRSGQRRALDATFGAESAEAWQRTLDDLAPWWEFLRTRVLEVPFGGVRGLGVGLRSLAPGRSLRAFGRRRLHDPRVRTVLEHPVLVTGSDPRHAPAFTAVLAYVERTFGAWTCVGGFGRLVDALEVRLRERGVAVRLGVSAASVTADANRVRGVRLEGGEVLDADLVVSAVDVGTLTGELLVPPPRSLRRADHTQRPAPGPHVVHLGLRGDVDLPYETVFHPVAGPGGTERGVESGASATYAALEVRAPDDPSLAPDGHRAVSVTAYRTGAGQGTGSPDGTDLLDLLAARGLDLRDRVVARVDQEAPSYGPAWRGAVRGRGVPLNHTPMRGLFAVGGTVHPGPGVPAVLLGAAAVAQEIGPA